MTANMNSQGGLTSMPEIIISILILWLAMYIIFIRPQRKKLSERINLQKQVKAGNWVLMQSGMYAYVISVTDKIISVSINETDKKPILFSKAAVVRLLDNKPELN